MMEISLATSPRHAPTENWAIFMFHSRYTVGIDALDVYKMSIEKNCARSKIFMKNTASARENIINDRLNRRAPPPQEAQGRAT